MAGTSRMMDIDDTNDPSQKITQIIDNGLEKFASHSDSMEHQNRNEILKEVISFITTLDCIKVDYKRLIDFKNLKSVNSNSGRDALAVLLLKKLSPLEERHKAKRAASLAACREDLQNEILAKLSDSEQTVLRNLLRNSDVFEPVSEITSQPTRSVWAKPVKIAKRTDSGFSEASMTSSKATLTCLETESFHGRGDSLNMRQNNPENRKRKMHNEFSAVNSNSVDQEDNYCTDDDEAEPEEEVNNNDNGRANDHFEEQSKRTLFNLKCRLRSPRPDLAECSKVVHNKIQLDSHMIRKHKVKMYRCLASKCDQNFNEKKHLDHHVRRNHHDHKEWICEECGEEYSTHSQLHTHKWRFHFQGCFACPYEECNFVANCRDALSKHKYEKHRKFVCEFGNCKKRFPTTETLHLHLQTHVDLKPYYCGYTECESEFKYKGNLVRHIRTKHFYLPITQKEQNAKGIYDNRDPLEFVKERSDQVKRMKDRTDYLFHTMHPNGEDVHLAINEEH